MGSKIDISIVLASSNSSLLIVVGVIAVVLLPILIVWWRQRKATNEHLRFREIPYQLSLNPLSFDYDVNVEASSELLEVIQAFQAMGAQMPRTSIDFALSIRQMITTGGYLPSLILQERVESTPQFLFLIEQNTAQDHRARAYGLIVKKLLEEGMLCDFFFFFNDIRVCQNDYYPNGINLWKLSKIYPEHHLIIIGSGQQLISVFNGLLAPWTDVFLEWRHRVLLSPKSKAKWGRTERSISSLFQLLPANYYSLSLLPKLFIEEMGVDAVLNGSPESIALINLPESDVVENLKSFFTSRQVQWIATCALYPDLNWNLTLHLGESLNNIVWIRDLLELSRIPWFLQGSMPPHVREQLIKYLEEQEPEVLNLAREKIRQLLGEIADEFL